MEDDVKVSKKFVFNIVISAFFLLIIYGFIKLISPFIISIFLGIVFTVVFWPIYIFFKERIKLNENFSAFFAVFTIFVIFVIPISIFGWLLFKEAKIIYPTVIEYYRTTNFENIKILELIPLSISDLKEVIALNIEEMQKGILKSGGLFIKNIFFFLVNLSVMFISMFFFFKDGKKILLYMIDIFPFSKDNIKRILVQFEISVNSIIRGIILTAFVQGIIAMIGFYIAGLSSPVLLGSFVMLSALVPFIGTATTTVPVIIYCYFTKSFTTTLFIFIWSIFIVGLIDNILRPVFIGNFSRMPIGLVFLGLIGGIKSFGPIGIFIGPIFIAIFITVLDIYVKGKNS